MANYTKIPENTFKELQMNAGIIVDTFDPKTGKIGKIIGATTGGIQFSDTPEYSDFGEDIDNCPKNTMELKKMENREVVLSGTFVTVSAAMAKMLSGSADVDKLDATHIIPRRDLKMEDFTELWFVGDYSEINTGANAGFLAIRVFNALNTSGFAVQTTDKGKGNFAFSFTGHYSMEAQDVVPYEIFLKAGEEEPPVVASITLDKSTLSVAVAASESLTATTVPADASVTWLSSDETIATVDNGVVTGVANGTATITASMTYDGQEYTATCEATVGTVTPSVTLDQDTLSLTVGGDTATLTATTVPAGETVTWTSSDDNTATVEGGVVSAVSAGTATITATITVDETEYTDTCTVTVSE